MNNQVLPIVSPNAQTEVGLIAAVITHNCFDMLRKQWTNCGTIQTFDNIAHIAQTFHHTYKHVTEWDNFIDTNEDAIEWNSSDWEDFVCSYAISKMDNYTDMGPVKPIEYPKEKALIVIRDGAVESLHCTAPLDVTIIDMDGDVETETDRCISYPDCKPYKGFAYQVVAPEPRARYQLFGVETMHKHLKLINL